MKKFMGHAFKKICSEQRGGDNDLLIVAELEQNKQFLLSLSNDQQCQWVNNIVDVYSLLQAFDIIRQYYVQGNISPELWQIASFYAFKHCEALDKELSL